MQWLQQNKATTTNAKSKLIVASRCEHKHVTRGDNSAPNRLFTSCLSSIFILYCSLNTMEADKYHCFSSMGGLPLNGLHTRL